MIKIVCIGYRSWAISIYSELKKNKNYKVLILKKKKIDLKKINKFNPEYILFYGWSWLVPKTLINAYKCIMLHPSKLPKFKGGSPLQNQIIRNIKKSHLTLFRMNEKIDSGNIIASKKISLLGNIQEIFDRMTKIGILLTKKMLEKKYKDKKQIKSNHKIYKRLLPKDSEITIKDLQNKNSNYLYNKIRMLSDPYPNVFIKLKDGKRLIIKEAKLK
jgi:methionyl-tRNA formyltransferase